MTFDVKICSPTTSRTLNLLSLTDTNGDDGDDNGRRTGDGYWLWEMTSKSVCLNFRLKNYLSFGLKAAQIVRGRLSVFRKQRHSKKATGRNDYSLSWLSLRNFTLYRAQKIMRYWTSKTVVIIWPVHQCGGIHSSRAGYANPFIFCFIFILLRDGGEGRESRVSDRNNFCQN